MKRSWKWLPLCAAAAAVLLTVAGCRCWCNAEADGEAVEVTETVSAVPADGTAGACQKTDGKVNHHRKHSKECQASAECPKAQ